MIRILNPFALKPNHMHNACFLAEIQRVVKYDGDKNQDRNAEFDKASRRIAEQQIPATRNGKGKRDDSNAPVKDHHTAAHLLAKDKSLKNNNKNQGTPQDTPQDVEQISDHVEQLVVVLTRAMSRARIQAALELKDRRHFLASYLKPGLKAGLIEMTLPDKPTSRHQRYRRTAAGQALADRTKGKGVPA